MYIFPKKKAKMNYLLFEGSSNVGKTSAIVRFANNLIIKHGYKSNDPIPPINSNQDFKAVLEKKNINTGKIHRIIINSASDTADIINECKVFVDNNQPTDLIEWLHNYFFSKNVILKEDHVYEIPMAKINHRNKAFKPYGMEWYKEKIDTIAEHILKMIVEKCFHE